MVHPHCSARNLSLHGESPMTFEEVVDQASAMVQRSGRVPERLLKRPVQLDDEALGNLKGELIYGEKLGGGEDGRLLIWTGAGRPKAAQLPPPPPIAPAPATPEGSPPQMPPSPV